MEIVFKVFLRIALVVQRATSELSFVNARGSAIMYEYCVTLQSHFDKRPSTPRNKSWIRELCHGRASLCQRRRIAEMPEGWARRSWLDHDAKYIKRDFS